MLNMTVPAIHTCSQRRSEILKAAQTRWVFGATLCCPFLSLCLFLTAFIRRAERSRAPALRGLLIVSLVNADYVELGFFFFSFVSLVVDYMCLNIEHGKINATCQREAGSDNCGKHVYLPKRVSWEADSLWPQL